MNRVQQLFLSLISSALTGKHFKITIDDGEFKSLENIAIVNKCLPLLYQGCVNCGIAAPLQWKHSASFIVMDSHRKLTVENEILNILKDNNIRACILKGSSVAMNYPNPLARSMGDIDILVDESNYEKAVLLFTTGEAFEKNNHGFHTEFYHKGIDVEIHKSILDYADYNSGIGAIMNNAMDCIEQKLCDSFLVPVLSDAHQAISLLTHMIRHLKENKFVFRLYTDWVAFALSVNPCKWQSDVLPSLQKTGLEPLADALNSASAVCMNISIPHRSNNSFSKDFCTLLIEEFLSVDKSGTPDGLDYNIGNLLSHRGAVSQNKISTAFSALNYIAKTNYSLGRIKLFLPLLWIYIPLRYFCNVLIGKRKKLNFKKVISSAKRRDVIYNELNL
ncbi:MAG: nucleotidyltransferase family protein [Clostridia bacterium]|nr:nucleotidyltransferase family protein [Clostridia bacterium]